MRIISIFIFYTTLLISCSTVSPSEQENEVKTEKATTVDIESSEKLPLLDLNDTTLYKLTELNSVNTHLLTEDELNREKEKIYTLQLSNKFFNWDNPTSGGAVHIDGEDKIEVYNAMWLLDSTNTTSKIIEIEELWRYVQGVTFGNSPSVLITSEYDLKKSKSIGLVINELFEHGPRIFIIESK